MQRRCDSDKSGGRRHRGENFHFEFLAGAAPP
jgi:hypothetical protein